MSSSVHYTDIYDPLNNEKHLEKTWVDSSWDELDPADGVWAQFVGYQRCGVAKDLFRNSINVDHPLWNTGDYDENRENPVYPFKAMPCEEKRVSFFHKAAVKFCGGEETTEMEIDKEDRENRVSRNFADMLCDYAEKCGPSEKKVFFKKGGRGMKWVSNGEMMEKLGLMIEETQRLMEDQDFKLNLSDVSVRNYPRRIFESFCERYEEWMDGETSFKMNAEAKAFVPGEQWMPLLSRSSPKKICGAYANDPPPPKGKPEKKRPAGNVSSAAQLCWHMKNESDEKLKDIEKKLELLIGMNGPVVKAKAV